MRLVGSVRLGRVIISRLPPGCTIPEHIDQGAPVTYYKRFHIALASLPGALNHAGDETVVSRPAAGWWFDHAAPTSLTRHHADHPHHNRAELHQPRPPTASERDAVG